MNCEFCYDYNEEEEGHLCAKKFIFENIFKNLFMGIFLTFRPQNGIEFWRIVMNIIETENIFRNSPDPSEVVYDNLVKCMIVFN